METAQANGIPESLHVLNADLASAAGRIEAENAMDAIRRLFDLAGDVSVPAVDYQTLKRQNDIEANLRLLKSRREDALTDPLHMQEDISPEWTFENMEQDDPATRESRRTARKFIEDVLARSEELPAPNLLITGASGSGKSHLAGAIAHELIARGEKVLFKNFTQFMYQLLDSADDSAGRQQLARMLNHEFRVLVLDDIIVQAKKLSDFRIERLSGILRARHNANLCTILTANCQIDVMQSKLGEYGLQSIINLNPELVELGNASYRRTLGSHDFVTGTSAPRTPAAVPASQPKGALEPSSFGEVAAANWDAADAARRQNGQFQQAQYMHEQMPAEAEETDRESSEEERYQAKEQMLEDSHDPDRQIGAEDREPRRHQEDGWNNAEDAASDEAFGLGG
ncbi:MAG: ATP-binding protein [Succinivibrionaceae bacterium]|nr:ATP-binding protein [Succinivibrionaceae bacterium]